MAVKVAKNRAGVAATAPSMETCQRTPDPARSHKAAPVWWGCLPATRLFLGLLLGPLGIGWAGRAWVPRWSDVSSGARCHSPRNATVTGPIPQRRRPTLPTTRVPACKAKTAARCQPLPPLIILHSLSFSSDRDFSLRISHDTPICHPVLACEYFDPTLSSRNRPNIYTVPTLASNDTRRTLEH